MVKVNGISKDLSGKTVLETVKNEGCSEMMVAVELNEEILPKNKFADTVLKDGDVIEIVRFVGGGSKIK